LGPEPDFIVAEKEGKRKTKPLNKSDCRSTEGVASWASGGLHQAQGSLFGGPSRESPLPYTPLWTHNSSTPTAKNISEPGRFGTLQPFTSLTFNKPSVHLPLDIITPNIDESEVFTDVFLCHAKLYVFGDKYDIQELKSLTLHNLQRTLQNFTIFPARVQDFLDLVSFTYEHTLEKDEEPLRMLLTNFCAWNIETLSCSSDFLDFYNAGGPFTMGVLLDLVKRLPAISPGKTKQSAAQRK